MKPEKLYHELKEVAERLGVKVSEQNLRITGVNAQSGACKVKGEAWIIIDKHKSVREKIEILAECLNQLPHEGVYMIPAVRALLNPEEAVQDLD